MNWISTHWKNLAPKAKVIIVSAFAYAASMSIPDAKAWISSNLGQHPKLTAYASSLLAILAVYQQPFVQNALTSLKVEQTSPDKVVVTQETK
jgi:hypothetical protein